MCLARLKGSAASRARCQYYPCSLEKESVILHSELGTVSSTSVIKSRLGCQKANQKVYEKVFFYVIEFVFAYNLNIHT